MCLGALGVAPKLRRAAGLMRICLVVVRQELGLEHVSVFFQEAETQNLDMQLVPPQKADMVDATGAGTCACATTQVAVFPASQLGLVLQATRWWGPLCGACARACRWHRAWGSDPWPLPWQWGATLLSPAR